ncbi:MAG TPA: FadR/GntR family transcriptional regulator [Anaerolineae bacterium]|nr:FadR/GntR family transcriptional regulator [Anaerolineae bacterium]
MANESPFRTVGSKGRLVDRVVNDLQRLIVDGDLELGMKLPPERELAEQLGVSRTVVREAVHILVTRGLLATTHGVGTMVQEMTHDHVSDSLSRLLRSRCVSLDKLREVRSILEVEMARLAALQATADDTARLQRILIEMDAAKDDAAAFVKGDAEFHTALAETTHNPLFVVLLGSIRDLMYEVRFSVSRYPDLFATVMPDHYTILDRVIARDVEGARLAMKAHLEHARRIQQLYTAQQEQQPGRATDAITAEWSAVN